MSKTVYTNLQPFSDRLARTWDGRGAILFVNEWLDEDLNRLFEGLLNHFAGQGLFAKKSLASLLDGSCQTEKNDLLLISKADLNLLGSLSALQVAQVISNDKKLSQEATQVDVYWDSATEKVEDILQGLAKKREAPMPSAAAVKALFLDRDDVIVRNVPYNREPAQVALLPGVVELIHRAHQDNFVVIICSNQSGIGRGRISWAEYLQVHQEMLRQLAAGGAWIEDAYWSAYIEDAQTDEGKDYPQFRKPRPGMFVEAVRKWKIDVSKSLMIGDSASDLMAAYAARVGRLYLHCLSKAGEEKSKLANFATAHAGFHFESIHSLHDVELV